eukprot:12931132-Prorocentrum_lima.AAC.1
MFVPVDAGESFFYDTPKLFHIHGLRPDEKNARKIEDSYKKLMEQLRPLSCQSYEDICGVMNTDFSPELLDKL